MSDIQFCTDCKFWEPDTSGLKPYRQGHCPKLGRTTDAISGEHCLWYKHKAVLIEFALVKNSKVEVVCFANKKFSDNAIEIVGDTMPKTWLEGYKWEDLNIMREAYYRTGRNNKREDDLRALHGFIKSFGFATKDQVFMHIWRENLPDYKPVPPPPYKSSFASYDLPE